MKNFIYLILIIVVIFFIVVLVRNNSDIELFSKMTDEEKLSYIKITDDKYIKESDKSYITGNIKNTSDKTINDITIHAEFFDADKISLKTNSTLITSLKAGETKDFKISLIGVEANPNIKSYELTTSLKRLTLID